ncbi:MAG: hypothetical protein F6J90_31695 [Moorea sp. SIOASIH]|uniref:hypothetical protein n=1 Tax=Moorena sp. SIOASIH TaxID=2607817 RepID=UPI0013BBA106|nr:hypothetical protein [Moorena sp. SIOASIH]NEO40652.1 hypothetical protein [Moorena sp. SIOASIH]
MIIKLRSWFRAGVLAVILCTALFLGSGIAYADTQGTPEWNDLVGIFSEDGRVRLDVGIRAMKEEVPASHDSWATRLVIERLDGPSSGPVEPDHLVGIFSEDGSTRLDLGIRAMKEEVPASHESWATRLRIVPLNELALGSITYGTVVGVFSEDARVRLDVGICAMKEEVPASHESWATRLHIRKL